VKSGETLSGIAKRSYGSYDAYRELWSSSPWITNPHWIYPGQTVLIPRASVGGEEPTVPGVDPELTAFARQRAEWIRERLTEADVYGDVRRGGILAVFAPGNVTRSMLEGTAQWIQTGPQGVQLLKLLPGAVAMGYSVIAGGAIDFFLTVDQLGERAVGAAPEGAYMGLDAETELRRELERLDAFLEGR
jgi:hypothetical protein